MRKRILEGLMMLFSKACKDSGLWRLDPKVVALDEAIATMEKLEDCPVMKRRWRAVRRLLRWLLDANPGSDGAYRLRLRVLLNIIYQNPEAWRLEPWEVRMYNRVAKEKGLKVRFKRR